MKSNVVAKKILKNAAVVLTAGTVLISAASCGSTSSKASSAGSGDSSKVQTIIVGSGNAYKPYCYLDENGKAVGYEYAVLKEIDKLLPQYKFEYQSMNFDNIVLSLDSGKIDLAAHQYESTPERREKYLFSKESYTTYVTYISVLGSDNTTKSLSDLAGQKVEGGGSTSATSQILTDWNDKHPDEKIDIVNHDGQTTEESIAQLKSGAVKAAIRNKRDVERLNKAAGDDNFSKVVGEPVNNSKTYYLYRKDETQLQEAVDGALKKLKESGKLAEISQKWLGGDFTEGE